ncbi:MAG: tetratricopeptide repeat protein [Desulfuromonadales bacterium]
MQSLSLIVAILILTVTTAKADEKAIVKEALSTLTLETAPMLLLKADIGNDAMANLILAEASFHGVLLIKSPTEAFKWYQRAANRGSAMAENILGNLYDNGQGVNRNPEKAAAWYLKAAQHDYPSAWFNIANCYEYGVGVPQDVKEAVRWYSKSALAGDVDAQVKLASLYESAIIEGTEPDQGLEWLRRAAEQGNAVAIQKLANIRFEHDSSDASVLENFMEDLVTLLPMDLATTLGANKQNFLEYAVFPIRYDYWQRRIPGKERFTSDCRESIRRLQKPRANYNDSITHLLGNSFRTILEIAHSSNRYDPLNEHLQRSMMAFVQNGNEQEYVVNYLGYKPQTLELAVERLYELRNLSRIDAYSQLVVATADLWITIWKESGHAVKSIPYSFVRNSVMANLQD